MYNTVKHVENKKCIRFKSEFNVGVNYKLWTKAVIIIRLIKIKMGKISNIRCMKVDPSMLQLSRAYTTTDSMYLN